MGWYSQQALRILKAFLENRGGEMSGADVIRETSLLSGTTYPILLRFERLGLLRSRWEVDTPQELGRPRRRLYSLTAEGERTGRAALSEVALTAMTLHPAGGALR